MTLKRFQTMFAAIACVAMVFPANAFAADTTVKAQDVALRPGGLLVGQVVNPQGAACANSPVVVVQNDELIVNTTTDANGVFAAQGLRGGQYQVLTPNGYKLCRFWAPETAPPTAADAAVVVTEGDVVRGQWAPPAPGMSYGGRWLDWVRSHPYITAGIVAAAIATPIAIAASDDDGGSGGPSS